MLPIHKIEAGRQNGFDIRFEFHPEDMDIADSFDVTSTELREIYYKIETGQFEWFWVECVASLKEVDLGTSSLGGCLYESFEQFVLDNDYAQDLIDEAIKGAREQMEALCKTA